MRWRRNDGRRERLAERELAALFRALPDAAPPEGMAERVMDAVREGPDLQSRDGRPGHGSAPGRNFAPDGRWGMAGAAVVLFVTVPLAFVMFFGMDAGLRGLETFAVLLKPVLAGLSDMWGANGPFSVLWSLAGGLYDVSAALARTVVKLLTGVAAARPDVLLSALGGTLGVLAAFVKLLGGSAPHEQR